jgi:hypothetical protein
MKKTGIILIAFTGVLFLLCGYPTMANSALVINEVRTGGVGDAGLEFIELYNSGDSTLALSGMSVSYYSTTGISSSVYTFASGFSLSSENHFLLVHSGKDVGVTPDGVFTQFLASSGGALALIDSSDAIIDAVAWGVLNTNSVGEGSRAAAPSAGYSITRYPEGFDTNDNSADFRVTPQPTPAHMAAVPTPIPAGAWLLGSGLIGMIGLGRTFRNKKSAVSSAMF